MRLLVLYGSETGTAQDLAENIWRESKQWGLDGPVLAFEDYAIEQLVEERLVIFVVATTGDGIEPANMKQAWRFLLRRSLPADSLQQLQFACLGLGDSSYAKFNYAAKKLNKRLLNLGATELCPLGLCDDQHDYGFLGVSLSWTETLFTTLSTVFDLKRKIVSQKVNKWHLKVLSNNEQAMDGDVEHLRWGPKVEAHTLKLVENTRTTAAEHFQDVRFLRFACETTNTSWQPGDVLDVQPENSQEQLTAFFELLREHKLDFDDTTVVEVQSASADMPLPRAFSKPISVYNAARYVWDLSAKPRQRFFEVLALDCDDEMEKEKLQEFCSVVGLEDVIAYVNRPRRTLLEVLQDFRYASAKLTLEKLFEMMPLIRPRSFSIASDASCDSLDLLVAVVSYKTIMQTPRLGLCSNWLKSLAPGNVIRGAIKPGTMQLPSLETPIILVGPGTGIAPFRSVIQSRLHAKRCGATVGQIVVYFGCRGKSNDFHFETDFKQWSDTGCVDCHYAFSRDESHKVYVQHLIQRTADKLQPLITKLNAHVYVAGSSNNMPKAVREAFIEVLGDNKQYLDKMLKERRYQEETWA